MQSVQPAVLVVILNYKSYDLTLKMVESLQKDLDYDNYSVMVIDNDSPNESAKELYEASRKLGFAFVKSDKNGGYAAGNNIGVRYAIDKGYKYTWIINNDLVLTDREVLSKLVTIAEEKENIACVGPKIIDIEGKVVAPYVNRPTIWNQTLGVFAEKKKRMNHRFRSGIVYRVYGCCMLVQNDAMREVNCMDERTFLYCEEDILAERFLTVGKRCFYCAEAEIIHLESMTVNREHGRKTKSKVNLVMESMDLYLKEYRRYGTFSRFVCKTIRKIIMLVR